MVSSNSFYLNNKLDNENDYNDAKNICEKETLGSLFTDKQLLFYAIIYRYFIKSSSYKTVNI